MMKLKQIKTYIIEIRTKQNDIESSGTEMKMRKNSCAGVIVRKQEREKGGEFKQPLTCLRPPYPHTRRTSGKLTCRKSILDAGWVFLDARICRTCR